MKNDRNEILSIVAFYLSEYDIKAVRQLGYKNRNQAITDLSRRIGNGNNYLKLRRDEFDALPDSASTRKGWANRKPTKSVVDLAAYLHGFSFEELTEIVQGFIASLASNNEDALESINSFSEESLEQILNLKDPTARITVSYGAHSRRVYNVAILTSLKKLYNGVCQLCGEKPFPTFSVDLMEAHHIDYFSSSGNNDADNIVILCPNHHRLIHKTNPSFDRTSLSFVFKSGEIMQLKKNYHLSSQ